MMELPADDNPRGPAHRSLRRVPGVERWLTGARRIACGAGPVILVLEHGYGAPGPTSQALLDGALVLTTLVLTALPVLEWIATGARHRFLQTQPARLMLTAVTVIGVPVWLLASVGPWLGPASADGGAWPMLRWWCEMAIGAHVLMAGLTVYRRAVATRANPALVLAGSFLAVILIGAFLLMLPKATAGRQGAAVRTAVFTSTSATCVTGLVVVPSGSYWSRFGQVVILLQMQLGGLGIMTFGGFLALLVGRRLRLTETIALQDVLNRKFLRDVHRLVVAILLSAFTAEAIGALLLADLWPASLPAGQRAFYSVFHAVSAFCNAGFSLTENSLVGQGARWQVWGVMVPLIVLGGLGFTVLVNLGQRLRYSVVRWLSRATGRQGGPGLPPRLALQTKLVLVTTIVLLVGGTVLLMAFEAPAHPEQGFGQGLADAAFQSVTARTAGFNTVEIGRMSGASQFLLMLLMFVGASPGSTGGGIKTATVAVILLSLCSALRRRPRTEGFRRTVPEWTVIRAMTVAVLFMMVIGTATLVLTATESAPLKDVLFEVTSATGTVGLSTGLTPSLSVAGQWVIVLVMFIGRIGPLTLLLALSVSGRPVHYEYAEEQVAIG